LGERQANGQGKLTRKSQDIFEGQFRNGTVEGDIIIHYADGSKFRGVYYHGVRNGKAIEVSKDGTRFEGYYRNGNRDGKFVERDRNGQVIARGRYDNGRRETE
jgi:antitoxin component YwqK of YwqJK toxin-antitoxin module